MSDCNAVRERFFAEPVVDGTHPDLAAHLAGCPACSAIAAALPQVDRSLDEIAHAPLAVPSFDRIAPAVARAAGARRRTTRLRRSLPAAVAVLSAAAAALVLALRVGGASPPSLEAGMRLESAAETHEAVLGSGARVRLDAGAIRLVAVGPGEERLLLDAGAATFEVPKLGPHRTLAVATPDAEVRVHGTRFQVVREAAGTTVSVTEGLVEVRPEGPGRPPTFLRPGESIFVKPLDGYRDDLRAAAQSALERSRFEEARERIDALLATEPGASLRAEALALAGWASAAQGERAAAIRKYREALTLLPHGERPLWADNAAAELALLLEREDPAAAAQAWAEYLRRFPVGVHGALARARVAGEAASK